MDSKDDFNIVISIDPGQLDIMKKGEKQLCVLLCCTGTEENFKNEARSLTWLLIPAAQLLTRNTLTWSEGYTANTIVDYTKITENTTVEGYKMNGDGIALEFNKKYVNTTKDPYILNANDGPAQDRVIRFENKSQNEFAVVLRQKCMFNTNQNYWPFVALPIHGSENLNIKPPRDITLIWVNKDIHIGTYKEKIFANESGYFIQNIHLSSPLEVEYDENSSWVLAQETQKKGVVGTDVSGGTYISSGIKGHYPGQSFMMVKQSIFTERKEAEIDEEDERKRKIDNAGY